MATASPPAPFLALVSALSIFFLLFAYVSATGSWQTSDVKLCTSQ
jgi:hypothetical protein